MATRNALTSLSLLAVLGLIPVITRAEDVLLTPEKSNLPEAVLVLIQGAEIPAARYVPLAQALQVAAPLRLWVGIPDFPLSTPEPLVVGGGVQRVLSALKEKNMSESTPLFVSGHSLGGIIVQDWASDPGNGTVIHGQVLLGSYLLRKWRNRTESYPVQTLTIGGELDGLSRITRLAEAFYHAVLHPKHAKPSQFPVVVLPSVSHMQFASGDPPALVKARDLKPEVSYDEAHHAIAQAMSLFITEILQSGAGREAQELTAMVTQTGSLVQPLIAALELEGFYHFKPPCYDNPPSEECTFGNRWSEFAQQIMGGLPNSTTLNVTDAFHPVWKIPVHLPHTDNNCTDPVGCKLIVSTVTQNVYSTGDSLDTAFVPVAATTMRVKMESRQKIWVQAGIRNADFNTTDSPSICAEINKYSFEWATENAAAASKKRFDLHGEPLTVGDDLGPYNAGPLWIWNDLHYDEKKPGPLMVVSSPMMKTPVNYWEPLAAGFHYCKLLSPARSMEWIYVDGLRAHYSINS